MDNRFVRFSRAGDAFHYRWAARRCLRLIQPHSPLKYLTVENSRESKLRGECAIDLAEYSDVGDCKTIAYFQLKHTTVRTRKPFTPSELAATIKAFAQRYSALFVRPQKTLSGTSVTFSFVTNRPVSEEVKKAVVANARGVKASRKSQDYLEKTTGLRGRQLHAFCASLSFVDSEVDYIVQKQKLKSQISGYIAGFIDSQEVDALIAMVADRALPESEDGRQNGEIHREDVLQRLGVSSERDLFPAPAEFEELSGVVVREQHRDILEHIVSAIEPIIIHAAGGVGKSVVARHLSKSLPKGSQGFLYDCFGGGKYRNPSEPRHRPSDALVQLANEMAARGLCRPMIAVAGRPADAIFRAFLDRLRQATECLRSVRSDALLVLLIDAADNAEMAATEAGDRCFAHQLLRESLPPGSRLVMFGRTERVTLLKPKSKKWLYELLPFSKKETKAYLRESYAEASDRDSLELHRLTGGNPRVQANVLAEAKDLQDVFSRLGPGQKTVSAQIASQLDAAILAVKDRHVDHSNVDAICCGLANLPPFVPIEVLAKAANVDPSTVHSFISDLGRPLWHTDDAVQFRDEPTETWFRERFGASTSQVDAYLAALEPLATRYTYVAKVLPQLLMRAEKYERLVTLALSDDLLPDNNAIDERDIRLYRLQFALKAALRLERYADAARLAFRAGEEAAGSERQLSLLQGNVHLIAPLQGLQRIQEVAYRRVFRAAWEGSQNVYAASLLSTVKDFHGEARTYLRAAQRWLQIHFAERAKNAHIDEKRFSQPEVQDSDAAELGWAILNLFGPPKVVLYLLNWRPPAFTFRVARLLIRRLVDLSRFNEIDEIARKGARSAYLMLAVADELIAVAHFPPKQALSHCLSLLTSKSSRIPKPHLNDFDDKITPAIQSLLEASAARRLSRSKIKSALRFYLPSDAHLLANSRARAESRRMFVRGAALKAVLEGTFEVTPSSLLPQKSAKKRTHALRPLDESEERDITKCVGALLPWYLLRARIIVGAAVNKTDVDHAKSLSETARQARYSSFEPLPWDVSRARFELLAFGSALSKQEIDAFRDSLKLGMSLSLQERLEAARTAFRLPHLRDLREPLELSCRETIEEPANDGPEQRANWFTALAIAVLPTSHKDAAAYLDHAVEAVSKFGDEVVERWQAVVAVARRSAEVGGSTPETAYRFIRCAEMVGDTVAREKYWDRDGAFRVAARLHAPSAFAALSRWRDRRVGRFDEQLRAIACEAVEASAIAPRVAWSLSGFEGCNASVDFISACIQRETCHQTRQHIFDQAVRDLELAGTSLEHLKDLEVVADDARLSKSSVAKIGKSVPSNAEVSKNTLEFSSAQVAMKGAGRRAVSWFDSVDLLTPSGVDTAMERFEESEPPRECEYFWKELILRIEAGREADFFDALVASSELDVFDMRGVLDGVKSTWQKKAAVRRAWPGFLKALSRRMAIPLCDRWALSHLLGSKVIDAADIAALKNGILGGLAESAELMNASSCFGLVRHIVDRLTVDDASHLLEYSLERFEIHVADDYGDGIWSAWITPPLNVSEAVVGLIWSALGSPYSEMRWQAAHCVRRLVGNSCTHEISLLINRMQTGGVGPFGSNRYPFYELHARLYLIIAFARTAVEDPTVLTSHAGIFARIALEGLPHILIQKTAADIALAIERSNPHSYPSNIVADLQRVGRSPLPLKIVDAYRYEAHISLGAADPSETSSDLYLGYDFERYWLEPLGEVFGVPEKEVGRLTREIAARLVEIPVAESKDPRHLQWEQLSRFEGSYNTWHDHGSYPRVDDYTFYRSYHACFGAAAEMLAKFHVIRHATRHYEENRWDDWLDHHSLTRSDGRWLSDRRDPTPVIGRYWIQEKKDEEWRWAVCADNFIEILRMNDILRGSLCASGDWVECDTSRIEEIHVASALVDRASSESVATALRRSDETFWSALPQFGNNEFDSTKFSTALTGWIRRDNYRGERLDSFDPYAREIRYPVRELGETFISLLNLAPDSERREWRLPIASDPSITCEVWSDKRLLQRDKPYRSGERIRVSVELLKALCARTGKDLLFEVTIQRRVDRGYSSAPENTGPIPPSRKYFLLSADGPLRDKQIQYDLG